jgi:malonate transporter
VLTVLLTVTPVFLVIGAGFAAVKSKLFSDDAVNGLMAFTLTFAVPCLLFTAIARLDLSKAYDAPLLLSFYIGATVSFILGIIGARVIFKRRPGESVSIGFGALFSNAVLLGLPISERAFGSDSLGPNYAIISIHTPFCYLLGITCMEFARADGRGFLDTAGAVVKAIFRNSLMLALGLGFLVNLLDVPVPEPVWAAVEMMARTALPASLFGLGGVLTRYKLSDSLGEAAMVTTLKLIVHPAITLGLATFVFGLSPEFRTAAVVTAAMAPGVNAYIFASIYNRAAAEAASAVLLATGLSVLTVSVWLYIL